MGRDRESPLRRLHVQLRRPHPLLDGQEEALARRPEREQPVEAAGGEEIRVRGECVLVERLAGVA